MLGTVTFKNLLGEGRYLLDPAKELVEIGEFDIMTTGRGDRALSRLKERWRKSRTGASTEDENK